MAYTVWVSGLEKNQLIHMSPVVIVAGEVKI